MKLKNNFLLRKVAGRTVVLPMSEELDMNMMITLNDTGAFLWEKLQEEISVDGLVAALLAEYDVQEDTARKAVEDFLNKLRNNGFLAE